jgi:CRISPR/Cas system-associated exonuclease Cas4 (RecB family)
MRKNSFLYRVAEDIKNRYADEMQHLTVVFPSRRSGRILQQHLIDQSTSPVWSPEITTIDELFKSHSDLTPADPLTQVSMLHEVWNKVTGLNEAFEKFYFFGKMILADFDQIDKYRVSPEKLFSHIRDLKEIEDQFRLTEDDSEALRQLKLYFSEDKSPQSLGAEFMKFWTSLHPVYEALKAKMREEKLAWSGMIYRDVAGNPEVLREKTKGKYLFCGFNRINRCEEIVFEHLKKKGWAEFYWNEDELLHTEYRDEAGKFLVKYLKKFPPVKKLSTNMQNDSKEVNITAVNFQSLQVQLTSQLMVQASDDNRGANLKTGVILNDEDLLLPLLHTLPEESVAINVSAGLNLVKTPVYDLMKNTVQMHENALHTGGYFHYRDIEQIFFNPLLPGVYKNWLNAVKTTDDDGRPADRRDQVYFSARELEGMDIHELVPIVFRLVAQPSDIVQLLLGFMEKIFQITEEVEDDSDSGEDLIGLNRELIRSAHQVLMRIRDTLPGWSDKVKYPLLRNILRDIAQSRRIPFKGEPLKGIQIMGALEARNVTFDHLILPSMNEGIQPSGPGQSLVPYSLKKYFGLPTAEDEMSDQSYYFRTLIAGAQKIDIFYDESTDGMNKSEPSRYVQQIVYGPYEKWKVDRSKKLKMGLDNNMPETILVPRTAEIQEKLLEQLQKRGLSPSRLAEYFSCELRFFFSFILGAKEKEAVPEEVDARTLGSILHKTMEVLYQQHNGKEIRGNDLEQMKKEANEVVRKTLKKFRRLDGKKMPGHDIVAERYLQKMVKKVLEFDKTRVPFTMVEHEKKIDLERQFNGHTIKFTGFVDRIHQKEGSYHIVDYKTGSDKGEAKKEEIWPMPGNDQERADKLNKAAIQTLTYCWLLKNQSEKYKNQRLIPELYTTRNLGEKYEPSITLKEKPPRALDTGDEFYDLFIRQLESSIESMLDESRPFKQTKDEKACKFCTFKNICMRDGGSW